VRLIVIKRPYHHLITKCPRVDAGCRSNYIQGEPLITVMAKRNETQDKSARLRDRLYSATRTSTSHTCGQPLVFVLEVFVLVEDFIRL
jgi:hypothetical protein